MNENRPFSSPTFQELRNDSHSELGELSTWTASVWTRSESRCPSHRGIEQKRSLPIYSSLRTIIVYMTQGGMFGTAERIHTPSQSPWPQRKDKRRWCGIRRSFVYRKPSISLGLQNYMGFSTAKTASHAKPPTKLEPSCTNDLSWASGSPSVRDGFKQARVIEFGFQ